MECRLSLIFFVLLPLVAVGYTPQTRYIVNYCYPPRTIYTSKDMLVTYSDVRHLIPASYNCVMYIQNQDNSKQIQVRFLNLDMQARMNCTAGAVVLRESGRYLTPSYGVCGSVNPSQSYRTTGNQMTIALTNTGMSDVYGDFKVLVTSIYNSTTRGSCDSGDFKCSNQLCVPTQLLCNGYNDCGDNSDEITGCALAAGVIIGIVLAVLLAVVIFSFLVFLWRRRRRSYSRVTEVVREYPTVSHQPVVVGGYNPSYTYSSNANNYGGI